MMMGLCLCTAGEIAAVIVGIVCSLAGVCIICLFILLKMYPKLNRDSSKYIISNIQVLVDSYTLYSETTEEEIEMKQNEIYGIHMRQL